MLLPSCFLDFCQQIRQPFLSLYLFYFFCINNLVEQICTTIQKIYNWRISHYFMDVERELKGLGFTGNEVKVYLALFNMGKARAGRIAKECSLERTSTYNALKRLEEQGIIASVMEGRTKVFSPGSPGNLLNMLKEKEELVSLLIPKLESIQKLERERQNILKFRGYNGVKTVLNDVFRTCKDGEEYLIMGSEGQLSDRMPVLAKIFVAQKDRRRISARVL